MRAAYVFLLIAIAVSIVVVFRLSLSDKLAQLAAWRRRLLLLGGVGNAVSLAALLSVIFHTTLMPTLGTDIEIYRILFPAAALPIALGFFGKRVPRVLVILNGIALTLLWLDVGASSL